MHSQALAPNEVTRSRNHDHRRSRPRAAQSAVTGRWRRADGRHGPQRGKTGAAANDVPLRGATDQRGSVRPGACADRDSAPCPTGGPPRNSPWWIAPTAGHPKAARPADTTPSPAKAPPHPQRHQHDQHDQRLITCSTPRDTTRPHRRRHDRQHRTGNPDTEATQTNTARPGRATRRPARLSGRAPSRQAPAPATKSGTPPHVAAVPRGHPSASRDSLSARTDDEPAPPTRSREPGRTDHRATARPTRRRGSHRVRQRSPSETSDLAPSGRLRHPWARPARARQCPRYSRLNYIHNTQEVIPGELLRRRAAAHRGRTQGTPERTPSRVARSGVDRRPGRRVSMSRRYEITSIILFHGRRRV